MRKPVFGLVAPCKVYERDRLDVSENFGLEANLWYWVKLFRRRRNCRFGIKRKPQQQNYGQP